VAILRLLLARNECICGEICDQIPLAQSTISQHLKIMKTAGLIQGEVDGPRICYCVNPATLQQLKAMIANL
jgi:ArsR family transcriptional regulator